MTYDIYLVHNHGILQFYMVLDILFITVMDRDNKFCTRENSINNIFFNPLTKP